MTREICLLDNALDENNVQRRKGDSMTVSNVFADSMVERGKAVYVGPQQGVLRIDPVSGAAVDAGGKPADIRGAAAANSLIAAYGVTAYNTCKSGISFGKTALTATLSNERPRFQTYTQKCVLSSSASEARFASASFTADQTEKALSIDVYIDQPISEFTIGGNPNIAVQLSNTTSLGSNFSKWSFDAGYLRQGWNTLKMRQADTVSATSGAGNLPTGQNHNADSGTGFDWTGTGQYISLAFNNMNGFTVHVDELRRPAKAKAVMTIGFDASGSGSTDEIFPNTIAPLFARYGIRSYTTMTKIYELIYSSSQAWRRIARLYNEFGWDCINHTWSHGATTIGRIYTLASLTRTSNVCTATFAAGHGIEVGQTFKCAIQGATGPGVDMNTDPTLAAPDCLATTATTFTYPSTGANGTATGSPVGYTYLAQVFTVNNAENQRLLSHEITDIARILKAGGFSRSVPFMAYPSNSTPELSLLQTVANEAGVKFGRAYRGGYTFVNEFGADNPLNMGSFVMDSGTNFTRLSTLQAKVQGAIDRGEHIHIFGHFIVNDEDPANAAYAPVDPDYPPGQGGNPAPPSVGELPGFGGWWYYSQLRKLVQDTIAPAIANGTLLVKSPSEYSAYMGG